MLRRSSKGRFNSQFGKPLDGFDGPTAGLLGGLSPSKTLGILSLPNRLVETAQGYG